MLLPDEWIVRDFIERVMVLGAQRREVYQIAGERRLQQRKKRCVGHHGRDSKA